MSRLRQPRYRSSWLAGLALFSLAAVPVGQDGQRGAVGSSAREFVLEGVSGESLRFPDLGAEDGALTVVTFWATWNEPGQEQLRRLAELWPKWSTHGVSVVAVNVEAHRIGAQEMETVRAWLEEEQLPFPVVIDQGLRAFHAYGVAAVPTTVVIDAAGTIVFRMPGYPVAGAERLIKCVEGAVIDSAVQGVGGDLAGTSGHRRAVRYARLSRQLTLKGELEMAEFTLRKAAELDPGLLGVRIDLAVLLERTQRREDAGRVLLEAASTFPEDSSLQLARAEFELRGGDLERAETLARAARELNPSLSGALLVLARVRRAADDSGGALEFLDLAAQANPLDARVHIELGQVHETLGDPVRAIESYEQAYFLLEPSWRSWGRH
jgi:cytochrome c biogenesis protein CcmG, thiol:disulfide interchange protein DsbE